MEKLVAEAGHRNQKMIGEVDGVRISGHAAILSGGPLRRRPPLLVP
jgi:hypothetical protein